MISQAAGHEGTGLIEIYQNCNIFNDGAFDSFREKSARDDRTVNLVHGQPLLFGKAKERGLRLDSNMRPEIVTIGENEVTLEDVLVWDENDESPAKAMALASMSEDDFPVPIGVFRNTHRPAFEQAVNAQVNAAQEKRGDQTLQQLLDGPDTWTVA